MTAVAEHLDRKLKTMPASTAASVEKLVMDVLNVVDASPPALDHEAAIHAHREHISKCMALASALDWSDFERPDQGVEEVREDW